MCRSQPATPSRWNVTPVDSSATLRWATAASEPASFTVADPNNSLSRSDRRAMLLMQVAEAARFQRACARASSLQRQGLVTNKRLMNPVVVCGSIDFRDEPKQAPQGYSLLTDKSVANLISDVKTLMNPTLAKDYTQGTVSQVCKLGLYQPSALFSSL